MVWKEYEELVKIMNEKEIKEEIMKEYYLEPFYKQCYSTQLKPFYDSTNQETFINFLKRKEN